MLKEKRLFLFIAVLAVFIALSGGLSSVAGTKLIDVQGHWAQQYIMEMNANDIILGDLVGTFRPDDGVTKLEVIALLIRTLGLEDQAKELGNTSVDYKMPPDLKWGKGYLIMAVQNGMLVKENLSQFQIDSKATRVEVAVLVYHALNFSPGGSTLSFTDSDQIVQDYRDCVSAVTKNNIIKGYPDNSFKPNEGVKRAEMAVILSRIIENKFAAPFPERRVGGSIISFDIANKIITVQKENNTSIVKGLASDCYVSGKKSDATALKVGDDVKLILDKNDQVVFVNVLGTNTAQKYKGKIDSLAINNGEYSLSIVDFENRKITYPLSASVKITEIGAVKDVSSLTEGKYVEIKITDNKIAEISSLETSVVKGTVASIRSSSLTLQDSSGTKTDLEVPSNVTVVKNGLKMTYADIKENNSVEIMTYDSKAIKIEILSPGDMEGEISNLSTTGDLWVSIVKDEGDKKDYLVDSSVEVIRKGGRINLSELTKGLRVKLGLNGSGKVTYIEVLKEVTILNGKIVEINVSPTRKIWFERTIGNEVSYFLSDAVTFSQSGEKIRLEDIVEGCQAEIWLEDDKIKRIEVTDSKNITVEGTVTDVKLTNNRVRIKQNNGNEFSYYMSDSPVLKDKSGNTITLGDVREDWEVKLELQGGKVYRLTRL